MLSDLKGVSVFDLNAESARELQPARAAFSHTAATSQFRARIKDLLGLKRLEPVATAGPGCGRAPGRRLPRQENC